MKRVLLKSVFDAFDYVMAHYAPAGLEEMAEQTDTYAVISIQDSAGGGFGFRFTETKFCREALTLYVDDVERPVDGAVLFSEDHARQVIDFIRRNISADTLLVHCYAGQSRSRAVAAFAVKMLGADNAQYFTSGVPNAHIYTTLTQIYEKEYRSPRCAEAPSPNRA